MNQKVQNSKLNSNHVQDQPEPIKTNRTKNHWFGLVHWAIQSVSVSRLHTIPDRPRLIYTSSWNNCDTTLEFKASDTDQNGWRGREQQSFVLAWQFLRLKSSKHNLNNALAVSTSKIAPPLILNDLGSCFWSTLVPFKSNTRQEDEFPGGL